MHALLEHLVEVGVVLENHPPRELRQLVVAKQVVNLVRMLGLQRADQIDELMRLVAAGGILEGAVDQLLNDEVASRVPGEVSALQQPAEVLEVPVYVPADEDLVAVGEPDEPAGAARGGPERGEGAPYGLQAEVDAGHERQWVEVSRVAGGRDTS